MKQGSITYKKQAKLAIHELTRVIYKFIPTFGKLTGLASYILNEK